MKKLFRALYHQLPITKQTEHIKTLMEKLIFSHQQIASIEVAAYVQNLLNQERYQDKQRLNCYERQVFSQSGEDGIIAEIFRRIGGPAKSFVEIGVGDGLENNTAFLLFQGGRGYWLDGDENAIKHINQTFRPEIEEKRLSVTQTLITMENVVATFQQLNIPAEFDLFSLDIDRNTYWIWKALAHLRPKAIVVEYNATFPSDVDWKVDYKADRSWDGTMYYGASLKAYELLGREFGYSLVGCSLSGVNAFFVRNDLCDNKFKEPFTAENHYEPARYFIIRRESPPSNFRDA
jgi:hypothetical protein